MPLGTVMEVDNEQESAHVVGISETGKLKFYHSGVGNPYDGDPPGTPTIPPPPLNLDLGNSGSTVSEEVIMMTDDADVERPK